MNLFYRSIQPAHGLALAIGLCAAFSAIHAETASGVSHRGPESLKFGDSRLVLARAVGDAQGVWKQYLPEGQTLEDWTESLSLYLYYKETDPVKLSSQHRELVQSNFPDAEFGEQITRDGREARLRYVVRTVDPVPISKFTLWRFQAIDDPRLQVLGYEYSRRSFGENRAPFNRLIGDRMAAWTRTLIAARYAAPEIRVNRRQVDAVARRGAELIGEGEAAAGIRLLIETTAVDPQNPKRFLDLGRVLFAYARSRMQMGFEQEALTLFSNAGEQLTEATDLYAVFDNASPDHAEAWYLRGEIAFHIQNNPEVARTHYEKALRISPNLREARQALEVFQ